MKGHPIRGFFAGLLLGIVLDLDLFLGGVVKSDAVALVLGRTGASLVTTLRPTGLRQSSPSSDTP